MWNFCNQKNIYYIDKTNIKKDYVGNKKLHLNQSGKSVFPENLLRYLRSKYWENVNFNCFAKSYDEYKSKNLSKDLIVWYEENLKNIRWKNLQNIVIGQLNINSLRNKLDFLAEQSKRIIDVLVISETKLYEPFPEVQFKNPGYTSHFRLDRDQHDEKNMIFIREDIPAKSFSAGTEPIEELCIEWNFHKRKWLLSFSYNPNENNFLNHLDALQKNLDLYSSEYKHVILLGDFNVETMEPCMQSFFKLYRFRNLISEAVCYKNL